eukprot:CAMPEP_0184744622 /NCGR_PEP_ID=MMETSP0315-20130426/7327_1 /TAXON_ID=101924 /ORGANISM="Rhodosorus marinus, Strain UTEX LB 2760" /LENGTH=610 /DNA_ID=CAMNT_0027216379 /DNA_START=105 /DNA_END=1938 /DNA_ORIENTATION=-
MVVTHRETGEQICVGLEVQALPSIRPKLEAMEAIGADFVVGPLVHPRYERGASEPDFSTDAPRIERNDPFTRSDMELSSSEWSSGFIGKLSPWIRCDSSSRRLSLMSEAALMQEIAFAKHLALRAVLTPPITRGCSGANFARALLSSLSLHPGMNIWVRVPLEGSVAGNPDDGDLSYSREEGTSDVWGDWNRLSTLCDGHPSLGIALELPANLPKNALKRWNGEPVCALLVNANAFVLNRHGFPVLPRRHQEFVREMFKYKCYIAVSGRSNSNSEGDRGAQQYIQYLGYLFGKQPASTEAERFEAPYQDFLQSPLQPLADNLESNVYEVFEKDPVKYVRYREAVAKYLETRKGEDVVIMVLGAGRGPLVKSCLLASQETGVKVKIYAVEKNVNAVVTLRTLAASPAWSNVEVIASDMRVWNPQEKADLVVSELLGSFGDNELSPECLDGASKCLKENGVSIPSSYTSFLAPMSSSKLRNEVRALGESIAVMETPYVVKIHSGFEISPSKECFTFTHPKKESTPRDNSRYVKLTFHPSESSMLTGLAGYFEAVLYDDVMISIRPESFSEGMFSWFPLYFPLRTPLPVELAAKSRFTSGENAPHRRSGTNGA